jgi:hypothetical protein
MPCCGGGGADETHEAKEPSKEDKFIPETSIDDTGIEEFDVVFKKNDAPLSTIIGMNNSIQSAIEQLIAAGSALFGANIPRASIKDKKLSFEIVKPPEKKDDKEIIIVVVTGDRKPKEPKDKGIEIKDKGIYDGLAKDGELLTAIVEANEAISIFNTFFAKKEYKDVPLKVENNRVKVDIKEKPDKMKELEKINMAKRVVNNFNQQFFPVKSGLAKQAFKDGLDLKKIIKGIMDKLKEAVKGMVPTVEVKMDKLMEGTLEIKVTMPGVPDIDTFFETNELIPPMFKKAWSHITGKGGFIDCCKAVAAQLKELPGQIKEAVEAFKGLPNSPDKIQELAKKAASSGAIGPFDVPKVPKKIKANSDQLMRLPTVMEEFVKNIKATLEEFADALKGDGTDASGGGGNQDLMGALGSAMDSATDTLQAVVAPVFGATETPKENGEVSKDPPETEATKPPEEPPTTLATPVAPKDLVNGNIETVDEVPVPKNQPCCGVCGF